MVDVVVAVLYGRMSSPRIRLIKLLLPEDVSPTNNQNDQRSSQSIGWLFKEGKERLEILKIF